MYLSNGSCWPAVYCYEDDDELLVLVGTTGTHPDMRILADSSCSSLAWPAPGAVTYLLSASLLLYLLSVGTHSCPPRCYQASDWQPHRGNTTVHSQSSGKKQNMESKQVSE